MIIARPALDDITRHDNQIVCNRAIPGFSLPGGVRTGPLLGGRTRSGEEGWKKTASKQAAGCRIDGAQDEKKEIFG
jgi:hypothetical protein